MAHIHGKHHTVAVATREAGREPGNGIQGHTLVTTCQSLVAIFSDSANRIALASELRLADAFYADTANLPAAAELPPFDPRYSDGPSEVICRRGNAPGLREFPFISTCLVLGASHGLLESRATYPARTEPPGTVFWDNNVEYGIVIVNISQLDRVCYGIVAFKMRYLKHVTEAEYDDLLCGCAGFGDLMVEEDRHRKAMSAAEYRSTKLSAYKDVWPLRDDECAVLEMLGNVLLVDNCAIEIVWPSGELTSKQQNTMPSAPCPQQKAFLGQEHLNLTYRRDYTAKDLDAELLET